MNSQYGIPHFIRIFIGMLLLCGSGPAVSAQSYREIPLENDTLFFTYEKPIINLDYNRYKTSQVALFAGIDLPVALFTERLRSGDLWFDVRIDFDESDGISYSSWYRSADAVTHRVSHRYTTPGTKTIALELKFTDITGRTKTVSLHDTVFVAPAPTRMLKDAAGNRLYVFQSGAYERPVLYLEGFDPANLNNAAANYLLGATLMAEAASRGYDVIIADWAEGGAAIETNAGHFEEMVRQAYTLLPDSAEACVQVIGVSMGGLIGRYGLAQMEGYSQGPQGRIVPHYTNTFISFDAPQQGVHINHQFQNFIKDEPRVPQDYKMRLGSTAARQMLYYNAFGQEGESDDFYNNRMRALNNNTPGFPNQNGGYPTNCGKYGVSNGNHQPVYTDKQVGVTDLGRVRLLAELSLSEVFLPWIQVRVVDKTITFKTEKEDCYPGSTYSGDIRKLERYINLYPNQSLLFSILATLSGNIISPNISGHIDLAFDYNPSYQMTESALDFKPYSYSRTTSGQLVGGDSYFDGTLEQPATRRHDELSEDSKEYVLNLLDRHRLDPYLLRVSDVNAVAAQRKVILSFRDNSILEDGTIIQRRLANDTLWCLVGSVPRNIMRNGQLTFLDTTVAPGTAYQYRMRSYAGNAVSPWQYYSVETVSSIAPALITTHVIWDDQVIASQPVVISGSGRVTIEPGVRVSVAPGAGITVKPGASLQILGTPAAPVLFTSSGTGKWAGLSISNFPSRSNTPSLPILLRHAIIERAEIGIQAASGFNDKVYVNHPTLSIVNGNIRDCSIGISGEGYLVMDLKNSVIQRCSTGIALRNMHLPAPSLMMENDSVRECETGLYLWNTAHAQVVSSVFLGADGVSTGIALNAFSFLQVSSSRIAYCKTGILLADRNFLSLSCSEVTHNQTGIQLNGESASLRARGNWIYDNNGVEIQSVDAVPDLDRGRNAFFDQYGGGYNLVVTKGRYQIDARENYWGGYAPRISSPVAVNLDPVLVLQPILDCDLVSSPDDPASKRGKYAAAVAQLKQGEPDSAWSKFESIFVAGQDSLEMHWALPGLIASGLSKTARDIPGLLNSIRLLPGDGAPFREDRGYTADLGSAFGGNASTALTAIHARLQTVSTAAETLACNLAAAEISHLPHWQYPNDSLSSDPGITGLIWDMNRQALTEINDILNHGARHPMPKPSVQATHRHIVRLDQNYPNPFNPVTTIRYAIPSEQSIRLAVYDVLGREVDVLANGVVPAGEYSAAFDATKLPTGIYYYRLQGMDFTIDRKMMFLK